MVIKVVINGFGWIGWNVLCVIVELGCIDIEVVVINDLGLVEINVYLLCYDFVYGCFLVEVVVDGDMIFVGGGKLIKVIVICDLKDFFWGEFGVEIVMECIGIFIVKEKVVVFLEVGVKWVLVFVFLVGVDKMIVFGVNDSVLILDDLVVFNVFCIMNCLLLVVYVLNEIVGIEKGFMMIIYFYIGD